MLHCLKNKVQAVGINQYVEFKNLSDGEFVNSDKTFTELGTQIYKELEEFFSKERVDASKKILTENYAENIKNYLDLFPRKKLPSGKLARSDKKNIENNFKWFFKNFDYDWETVLEATAHYVDEYEKKNYLYMQTSQYFICKTQADKSKLSQLADYCAMIKDGIEPDEDSHFKEKVV